MFFGVILSDTINVYQFDPICTNFLHLITIIWSIWYCYNTYLIFPYGTWTSYICGDANGRPCHCCRANGNFRAKQGTVWVAQPKEMGYLQWFCVNLFLLRKMLFMYRPYCNFEKIADAACVRMECFICMYMHINIRLINTMNLFANDGSGSPWGGYTVAWGICPALWQRWPEATIV